VEGVPELDDVQANVLVEGVEDDLADALVVPGAVHKKQSRKEPELAEPKNKETERQQSE
jgi:hypothetical protein